MPELGRSSVPIRCSNVDFPEPEGPTIATSSPRSNAEAHPGQRHDRRLRRIRPGHRVELEHDAHSRGHHDALTGSEAGSADLHEAVGIVEDPEPSTATR